MIENKLLYKEKNCPEVESRIKIVARILIANTLLIAAVHYGTKGIEDRFSEKYKMYDQNIHYNQYIQELKEKEKNNYQIKL